MQERKPGSSINFHINIFKFKNSIKCVKINLEKTFEYTIWIWAQQARAAAAPLNRISRKDYYHGLF